LAIKLVTDNRKATFDYSILETFESGIVLTGTEVKAIRGGHIQLKDSYIDIHRGELFLISTHISPYKSGGYANHEPERKRKLLMKREQIDRLDSKMRERGLSIIPLKVYFKDGLVKVEIALAKGKKSHDKRESIKRRDADRELLKLKRKTRWSDGVFPLPFRPAIESLPSVWPLQEVVATVEDLSLAEPEDWSNNSYRLQQIPETHHLLECVPVVGKSLREW
jgi:SsrA-binding protein